MMKKIGFTLAEILVALAIIGIVAAVAGPAISNIAPDRHKVAYLDYRNKLIGTIEKALSDNELYSREFINKGDYYELEKCIDLGCYSKTLKYSDSGATGASKLAYIIHKDWEIDSSDCEFGETSTIKTRDGVEFVIVAETDTISDTDEAIIDHEITMKLTGGGKPCIYDATKCKFPRWFIYKIDTYGNITPGDRLGEAYLRNPHKMNNKKKDYDCAKNISQNKACTD